jgi:hypothetical protein
MTNDETFCDLTQQAIAVKQSLSDVQLAHIKSCAQCRLQQHEFQHLDSLVDHATLNLVPDGFVERVMARLPTALAYPGDENLLDEKLLAMFTRSRLLRTVLLGLGMAVGLNYVVQIFLSLFITTIAAAL